LECICMHALPFSAIHCYPVHGKPVLGACFRQAGAERRGCRLLSGFLGLAARVKRILFPSAGNFVPNLQFLCVIQELVRRMGPGEASASPLQLVEVFQQCQIDLDVREASVGTVSLYLFICGSRLE
jgi:hypothetical protein